MKRNDKLLDGRRARSRAASSSRAASDRHPSGRAAPKNRMPRITRNMNRFKLFETLKKHQPPGNCTTPTPSTSTTTTPGRGGAWGPAVRPGLLPVQKRWAYGYRAAFRTLDTYRRKHGCVVLADYIARWAPPSENDTAAYLRTVCRRTGCPTSRPSTRAARTQMWRRRRRHVLRRERHRGRPRRVRAGGNSSKMPDMKRFVWITVAVAALVCGFLLGRRTAAPVVEVAERIRVDTVYYDRPAAVRIDRRPATVSVPRLLFAGQPRTAEAAADTTEVTMPADDLHGGDRARQRDRAGAGRDAHLRGQPLPRTQVSGPVVGPLAPSLDWISVRDRTRTVTENRRAAAPLRRHGRCWRRMDAPRHSAHGRRAGRRRAVEVLTPFGQRPNMKKNRCHRK